MYTEPKIILDLCGGTGAWSKPYLNTGYDTRLITLPFFDVCTYQPPPNVYGILAAPPCTMFSLARQNAKTPRDMQQAMIVVAACLKIIWQCEPRFWALENPRGLLRRFLGKPAMTFKHSEFGTPLHKPTDLWGYFNPPKRLRNPVHVPLGLNRASKLYPHDPTLRARTPEMFALAFFKANP